MANLPIYRRTLDGFAPASDDAALFFGKTKLGQLVTLDGKRPRNLGFHRLFFAMLRLISDNSNPHISEEQALYLAKAGAGCGTWLDTGKRELFVPDSISFAAMDQAAFDDFVKRAIPPLVTRFMAGTAPDAVIREALELAQ